MTLPSSASKPLANIPRGVLLSTLWARRGLLGIAYRTIERTWDLLLRFALVGAQFVPLVWIPCFFAPSGGIRAYRLAATAALAFVFALCVVHHFLELLGSVAWADRAYPVVLDRSRVHNFLVWRDAGYALGPVTAAFALVLWLSWKAGWQDGAGSTNTLTYAAINSGLAAAMFLYGRLQPYYLFRKPTAADREWVRSGGRERLIRGQVTQPAPTLQAEAQAAPDYATPVQARAARTTFGDIFGMAVVKQRLFEPAQAILAARTDAREPPANGILMHGAPGNGKTGFAEALAGELQVPIVALTYGDIASKWLGEMPRLIVNCFAYAKEHAPCVLFIDEIDSFLRSRDSGSNNSEDLKIVNTLLTQLVEIRQHPVVVVAATNYLANLDAAAIREGRFDFKVEITPPDETARVGLLQKAASKYGRSLDIDQQALLSVAKRWNGFSVSRLLAVGKELPKYAREQAQVHIGFDDWMAVLRLVQGRKGQPPANTKALKDLILEPTTRDGLELIASRLKDAQRIEEMGGTLPSGILFHGPSGTGKTAAACALAVDCGWAFLAVAGPDLLADRDKISKLYAEAADLRPALVFIDEADDVLRNRQYTATPDIVNRMLALMDGASERVNDVVFIAATNNPDQIDPALVRAGRFTEKIEFFLPPADQIPRAVGAWLKAKRVNLGVENDSFGLAEVFSGQSMANVEGILQYALNRAISRTTRGMTPILLREDLQAGLRIVSVESTKSR